MSARLPDSSPLFELGGLEFKDPVLPKCTFPWKTVDVRVSDPSWAEPYAGPVSVSLQDILGGSLVTFGEHIGPPLDPNTPIPPKAVYVQYQEADPITGQLRPVIVPAQLCLDVYADLSLGHDVPEEESLLEDEETEVEEQSDRRKLRSSIKGDPILLRSKPVRPPEPYFAVMREDGQVTQAAVLNPETAREALASARDANGLLEDDGDGAACGAAWQQDGTAALGDDAEKIQGTDRRKALGLPMPKHVQTKSTVSSFIKAGGRDRYCRPRLREIDTILDRAAADSANQPLDARPSMGPAALARTEALASRLTAVLASDMHRMPQFHRARAASVAPHSINSRLDVEQLPPATAADDTASASEAAASLEDLPLSTDKADEAADALEEEADKKSIVGGASSEPRSWRRQDRRQTSSARSRGAAARKLRLIDPHVTTIVMSEERAMASFGGNGSGRDVAKSQSLPTLEGSSLAVGPTPVKICPRRPMLLQADAPEADFFATSISSSAGLFDGSGRRSLAGRMVLQGSQWGSGPPSAGTYKKRFPEGSLDKQTVFQKHAAPATQFRHFYDRGDMPVAVKHGNVPSVSWTVSPEEVDYMFWLPKFFEGLMESHPYGTIAYYGLQDLLQHAEGKRPSKVAPTIASLVLPIKRCLHTRDNDVMCRCMKMLQLLARCDKEVGPRLVPYFRQILPVLNMFKNKHRNMGDSMDYGQRRKENVAEVIQETLEVPSSNCVMLVQIQDPGLGRSTKCIKALLGHS